MSDDVAVQERAAQAEGLRRNGLLTAILAAMRSNCIQTWQKGSSDGAARGTVDYAAGD